MHSAFHLSLRHRLQAAAEDFGCRETAQFRNVQRFDQDFSDAQTILLEQNYRSRQNILNAAMGVIDRASNRKRKKLFTDRGEGEKIFFYEAPDDYSEASFVVDSIAQLVAGGDFEPSAKPKSPAWFSPGALILLQNC